MRCRLCLSRCHGFIFLQRATNFMTDSTQGIIDLQAVENLRELNPDDPNFLRELVDLFLADIPARIAEIEKAIATQDASLLTRAAHTIKGSSGNFGALQLAKASLEIEQQGKTASFAAATAALPALKAAFDQVAEVLKKLA
jgi:HPt (histidine-containing phosphotransfer) domain-containing protein